ncbi:ATP-grasp domain-containing protein [Ruminiclostridium herbifermentans]|uniref:ATP-grasp domain-containing protein n=1 Tax=Ruminiclostridium herbifermentans TaxID=2488810 RepID=A0A4U7JHZ4_9FIRM|nr:ATP-grasp domain-containing protein [Ruminiclostridium herbifermentans]QNU66234.1 ATP-grasp domain-containing protein [Ruminiclostridium herbifermentans]
MLDLGRKNVLIIHKSPNMKDITDLIEYGVNVIVLGREMADNDNLLGIKVDPHNHAELISTVDKLKKSISIDAVIPIWEATVIESAIVSDYLKLKGNSKDAVIKARNKFLLASCLDSNNISTAKSYLIRCIEEAEAVLDSELSYPCIMKLPYSANSQSVVLINNHSELVRAFYQTIKMHRSTDNPYIMSFKSDKDYKNAVLLQEFIEGVELNIDLAYSNNHFELLGVFEKAPMKGPYFAEYRSTYPINLSQEQLTECIGIAEAAVKSLGASIGCAHVEVKYGKRGPTIIELSLRPGGAYTMHAIELISGIKVISVLTRLLLDGTLYINDNYCKSACLYGGIVLEKSGVISQISNIDIFKNIPQIVDYNILFKNGDNVQALPEGSKIHLAHYIMSGNDIHELLERDAEIRSAIKYTIQ